jgi:hypothetical protein
MGYILKNTSGLINSRLTDAGRKKLSQGSFNISYFQIGDCEVSYNLPSTYNQFDTMVLSPGFNSHNSSFGCEPNKQYIKYPYYVRGSVGNTYGIPSVDSQIYDVFNTAAMRGFFSADLTATTLDWSAITTGNIALNCNYIVDMTTLNGSNTIQVSFSACNSNILRLPQSGDVITIYYNGVGLNNCSCVIPTSPTPTPTPSATPLAQPEYPCETPLPTPTPTGTNCPPEPTRLICTPPEPTPCLMSFTNCYPILTYKVVSFCNNVIELDRPTPNFSYFSSGCYGRILFYPSGMTELYDSLTPREHWREDVINFESVCDTDQFDVKIWNMNIPWSENPAGLMSSTHVDYTGFGSVDYLGSKEYYGYSSSSGQTDSSFVFYNNSLGDRVTVRPEEQKAIAIIHYTNQTIDYFYGEKFAMQAHDLSLPADTTGEGRNFRLHIPWLMWHKSPTCCSGQTFWVDPPGFETLNLFQAHYLTSNFNQDMNRPGHRYFHLWDGNENEDGYPSRIGKVFPDDHVIVIDDEEIIAAMSYKSNRNWTLPAPRLSLVAPNVCGGSGTTPYDGLLTGNTQYMYITYLMYNSTTFTNFLHCNYYSKIQGPNPSCDSVAKDVAINFGNEFACMNVPDVTPSNVQGFIADQFYILAQIVEGDQRPDPSDWRVINKTDDLQDYLINGFIPPVAFSSTTFIITSDDYSNAIPFNLADLISLTTIGQQGITLNFGDEYYFYGSIETDIQATIYEMRYKVNLGNADFQNTTNPTWTPGTSSYITDIGLYDEDKNLMIISKMQSPVLRTGIQQFLIKFDF